MVSLYEQSTYLIRNHTSWRDVQGVCGGEGGEEGAKEVKLQGDDLDDDDDHRVED